MTTPDDTDTTDTVAEPTDAVDAPEALDAVDEAVEDAATEDAPADDVAADDTVVEDAASDDTASDDTEEAAPARPVVGGKPTQTVGRRKQAIVRVRLMPGTGKFLLNGRSLEEYFPNKVHQQLIREPLVTVERPESFDIFARLQGGGITGQAGALRLAIARALIEVDIDDRPALKKAGFLTRDPRAKERKKYGLKKARKAPQYSKR
ncbi:MAG TPA: 30S ribosomal protein S9 [Pseudonocardiaceae bacterium]|nr:30S ribosomal protein S9 [Pseudonocardiaceae bacterium]